MAIGSKWLSQAVEVEEIESRVLNIIQAPTGSGKTYFALNDLTKLASKNSRYLYLIDTVNGKEQILKYANTTAYNHLWECYIKSGATKEVDFGDSFYNDIDETKIVVLTYAKFGALAHHTDFLKCFDVIVCDELHSGVEMSYFSKDEEKFQNYTDYAMWKLRNIIKNSDIKVVALTATPTKAVSYFSNDLIEGTPFVKEGVKIKYIPIDENIKQYETLKTIPYTNPFSIFDALLAADKKGIIYTPFIKDMERIEKALKQQGIKAISIWSIRNKKTMNTEQLKARKYVIENQSIPNDYDVLIINKSLETSVTIGGDIDFIIVHSRDADVQKQVRGRFRGDLRTLYVYSNSVDGELHILPKIIGKRLFKADTKALCEQLQIRDKQGRVVGWTTIKTMLENEGYSISGGRYRNKQFYIITVHEE